MEKWTPPAHRKKKGQGKILGLQHRPRGTKVRQRGNSDKRDGFTCQRLVEGEREGPREKQQEEEEDEARSEKILLSSPRA